MKSVRIIAATKEDNFIKVVKEIIQDDDTVDVNCHVFREDTVEWRMAEYDLDVDEALDLLLWEPFFEHGTPGLFSFQTPTAARDHVRSKVAEVKAKLKPDDKVRHRTKKEILDTIDETFDERDPHEAIKALSSIGTDELKMKKEYVGRMLKQRNEVLASAKKETPRGATLRTMLQQDPGRARRSTLLPGSPGPKRTPVE